MRYFTADLHLGHENLMRGLPRIVPACGLEFADIEAHDEYILDRINRIVKRDDELHILGDFTSEPAKYRHRIKCRNVYLTRGNHDKPGKSKIVFGEIPWMRVVKLRGNTGKLSAVLSHAPQAFWIGSHNGWAHLYGHTHARKERTLDEALGPHRRSIDVGIDNAIYVLGDYKPFSEVCLYNLFTGLKGHDNA